MKYKDKSGFVWKNKETYYKYMSKDMSKPKRLRQKYLRLSKK